LSTTEELVMPVAAWVLANGAAASPVAEKPNKSTNKAARKMEINTLRPLGKSKTQIKQKHHSGRIKTVFPFHDKNRQSIQMLK
jgi:hypothetical protein